jgi:pimeloyl-ACP methyl ester carboxylesterase
VTGYYPIDVRSYGTEGQFLILLHGGPGNPGEMSTLARYFCNRFQIIEPLQRHSIYHSPLTVTKHVEDMREILDSVIYDNLITLIGFSWGAMLALTYAARHPNGIKKVILIGCGTFDKISRQIYQNNIYERLKRYGLNNIVNEMHSKLEKETDQMQRNKIFAQLGEIYTKMQSFELIEDSPEELVYCDEQGFRETWSDALRLQEQGIQPAEFSAIKVPVIMIHGADDPHPGDMIFQSLNRYICHLKFVQIPQCGHKPWIELRAKAQFYQLMEESLA